MQAVDPKNKTKLVFSVVGVVLLAGLIAGVIGSLLYTRDVLETSVAQSAPGQGGAVKYNFDQAKTLGIITPQ